MDSFILKKCIVEFYYCKVTNKNLAFSGWCQQKMGKKTFSFYIHYRPENDKRMD